MPEITGFKIPNHDEKYMYADASVRDMGYGAKLQVVEGSTDAEFLSNIEALCAEKIKNSTFQALLYPPGEAFDGNSYVAQIWHNADGNGNKYIKIKAHGAVTTGEWERVCYYNSWDEPKWTNSADIVVAQGKSGIWTYRKWESGIAECWGSIGMTAPSAYTHALPFNFTNGELFATVKYHDQVGYNPPEPVNGWVTGNQIKLYTVASGVSSSATYLVSVHVIGTWK